MSDCSCWEAIECVRKIDRSKAEEEEEASRDHDEKSCHR